MRNNFTRARRAIIATLLLATTLLWASPTGASVPGKPFTVTHCQGDTDSVARLYSAGLGREAELGGFEFWVEEYVAGRWTLPRMAQFFVESPEFQSSYGALDDAAFINLLYLNVQKRPADQGGLDFWLAQMQQGMTRATVLLRFSESPENITNTGTAQPTLGDYNEGRNGAFHCGPDLSPLLLQLSDFTAGFAQGTASTWPAIHECYAALTTPGPYFANRFTRNGTTVDHELHHFPTPAGAIGYLDNLRATIPGCDGFSDAEGRGVSMGFIDGDVFGDDTEGVIVAAAFSDGSTVAFYQVAVRVGNVISNVVITPVDEISYLDAEVFSAIAAERLAAAGF